MLADLNRRLDQRGLALESLGDIDRQSLAGSIHRHSRNRHPLPQPLRAGRRDGGHRRRRHPPRVERELRPRRLAGGPGRPRRLGAIYSVTLQTVTNFRIDRTDRPRPLPDVLAALDSFVDELDHFEFYVFPHTEVALCRESMRTQAPAKPASPASIYAQEVVVENWIAADSLRSPASSPPRSTLARMPRPEPASRASSTQLQGLRLRAPGQVHRDGVRDPAGECPRGDRAGDGDRIAAGAAGLLPDRGPLRGRRRRDAQPRARPRQRLHRGPPRPSRRLAARTSMPSPRSWPTMAAGPTGASATARATWSSRLYPRFGTSRPSLAAGSRLGSPTRTRAGAWGCGRERRGRRRGK